MGYSALFERERLIGIEDQIFAAQMAQQDPNKAVFRKHMALISELVRGL